MADTTKRQQGFAIVETALIIVIIAVIVGVGYWVVKQRNKNNLNSSSSMSNTSKITAAAGTTASIDQLTQSDSKAEAAIDQKYEASEQSAVTSTNTALNNLGGAYNESSY